MDKKIVAAAREQLSDFFARNDSLIESYLPDKARSINGRGGVKYSPISFVKKIILRNLDPMSQPMLSAVCIQEPELVAEMLEDHCRESGLEVQPEEKKRPVVTDPIYTSLTLNMDVSHTGRDAKFFMTTPDEYISEISGPSYLKIYQLNEQEAVSNARKVIPEYMPRKAPGLVTRKVFTGEEMTFFNSYVPPVWMREEIKTPPGLPPLFQKLVTHLFPVEDEREYFFDWLHASLFKRSFVYLVLCGAPGSGKNRLKLVLRALHGHHNTVDGKKSTFSERFNSQLERVTLAWFDELRYSEDEENVMKEVQNDTVSIERKGVDATRSTRLFASMVISNNQPRDNFIPFDARKFAPLVVRNQSLLRSMRPKEIAELTRKVEDWSSPKFDQEFIAQIGNWVRKRGMSGKWPNLEYKGPMFYRLAHTSMRRWQKKIATAFLDGNSQLRTLLDVPGIDPKKAKGLLWSDVAQKLSRRSDGTVQFPDYSSVEHFFSTFVDGSGEKVFRTTPVEGSLLGDFYVQVVKKNAKVLTEREVLGEIEIEGEDEETSSDSQYVEDHHDEEDDEEKICEERRGSSSKKARKKKAREDLL